MSEIIVNNIVVNVERKDIKNLNLAVLPPRGNVCVASPMHMNDEAIRLFVISRLSWIKKQKNEFEAQQRELEREYISGESHYFQGNRYLLNIISSNENKVFIRDKKTLDLYITKDSDCRKRKRVMDQWYRQQLQEKIAIYIAKWQKIIGVEASGYAIRQMKTRWGSCHLKKRHILFNLELAKKPLYCLEYVIMHELVHLLERNHNNRFFAYMTKFMPLWRAYRDELNFILGHAVWKNL